MSIFPSTVSSLWETASDLLIVAEDALAPTIGGTPERSYLSPGEPAFDCCPFLSVHVGTLTEDTTLSGPGGVAPGHRTSTGSIILAQFVVQILRCAPEVPKLPALPLLTNIEAVAREVEEDGWALWNAMRSAIKAGEIFGMCQEVYFDGGAVVPEQGGCVGWKFTIRASIPGIPFEASS